VIRTPGLGNVLAVQAFAYACVSTVLGLWAGPYLHDVHRMDPLARGHVLAAMSVAQIVGVLACGPLDALLNTRKWIVLTGGAATVLVLAALAVLAAPSTTLAVTLLIALCGVASFGVTLVAHGRSLFPDRLIGRGMTTLNLSQVLGASLMPLVTGAVAAALAAPGSDPAAGDAYPEIAYRAIFGLLALALALGLAAYARGPDAKPRPAGGR
jgi:MFS family permease